MRQYLDAKQQHRDAILLFRMGDFYGSSTRTLVAARTLEITLTSRSKDANGGGIRCAASVSCRRWITSRGW
jgi:DNA mismatch repair protein MutS